MELEGSLRRALLKRWLLMDGKRGCLEDGQDEASQKLAAPTNWFRLEENRVISLFA